MPRSKAYDPFQQLSFSLGRAYYDHLQAIERILVRRGLAGHLASGMGQILFRLFDQGECLIKDLAGTLRVSPSRLTAVLGRMEAADLIERSVDAADRRAIRVRLSRFGRSLEPDCRAVLTEVNAVLAEGMSAREVAQLKRQLDRMVRNLAAHREATEAKSIVKTTRKAVS